MPVVADEVRKLAENIRQATHQIQTMLHQHERWEGAALRSS
ncbi:hypothetical protein FBY10_107190 [Pseudomonas sp. SJZ103]|nr:MULTISPECIES: methyl-accepting chemotaxis protein [unclassified Pseudomonas]MBB6291365.1 methyl-accepting chemotaxis protein [Pseudomonas sp. SJZ073]MBB6316423.1 methyl-accepting chemotaxis protein [Pseudomonas sp. JAI120]NJJ55961.1 methyl-accepting chemotaxis protein [Pseudomonas sp. B14(2022)]TWC68028.1 hypothetical protein FBY10_107190 [Pseudomonas sp. SJZ103]TWC84962.1 hypothetical protein FBY08_107190 [Pseudomonas sp. SJZ094]